MLTTPTDIEFKVVSDESTLTGDSESLMKITIQSKIPQLVASKPLITCDEDMEWDDMVERFIYRVCRMQESSEGEQKKFWKRWKSVVYQNMRVRKNCVTGKIRERLVRKWHLLEKEEGYPFLKKCRVLIQNLVKAEERLDEEQA